MWPHPFVLEVSRGSRRCFRDLAKHGIRGSLLRGGRGVEWVKVASGRTEGASRHGSSSMGGSPSGKCTSSGPSGS